MMPGAPGTLARCGEIPAHKKQSTYYGAQFDYPTGNFTPQCLGGIDSLTKSWMGAEMNAYGPYYNIPSLTDYTNSIGTGYGEANIDTNYGDTNTTIIAGLSQYSEGGYHAAALYCDKLVFGGYSDWYLPNRYELNLFYKNRSLIPGLDLTGNYYWSSTEYSNYHSWIQRFQDGHQWVSSKSSANKVRCVRRF